MPFKKDRLCRKAAQTAASLIAKQRSIRGFSLLELMIAIAITLTVAGITTIAMMPVLKQQHVTSAYNATLTTLRRAHDQAAADMRIYVVSFAATGTITVTQNTLGGPLLVTTVLPPDITFHVEPGVPTSAVTAPTTPDGFGTAAKAMDFDQGVAGGSTTDIYFQPDGTALDVNGNVNNGIVYLGRPGDLMSSRAITLWGTTGRLRGWRLYLSGTQNAWSQQ
jgi:prepilin-type N-terminal cleavage/methylation domain-containing protein